MPDDQNPTPVDALAYRDGREDVPALGRQIFAAIGLGSINWVFPAVLTAVGLLLIGWTAFAEWRKGRKVVLAGICIGIGLCLLCEGLCLNGF